MEGFVGEEDFVGDTGLDREPVEVDDVLPGLVVGEIAGSWILRILEPVQGFAGYPRQDSVAGMQQSNANANPNPDRS